MKKYYKDKSGVVGYYENGMLHGIGFICSAKLESLIPATDEEITKHKERECRTATARVLVCVKARDGGCNTPDVNAGSYGDYVGTACDGFDVTYRYYYYHPVRANGG